MFIMKEPPKNNHSREGEKERKRGKEREGKKEREKEALKGTNNIIMMKNMCK